MYQRVVPFEEYDERQFAARYRLTKAQVIDLYNSLDGIRTLEPQRKANDKSNLKSKQRALEENT